MFTGYDVEKYADIMKNLQFIMLDFPSVVMAPKRTSNPISSLTSNDNNSRVDSSNPFYVSASVMKEPEQYIGVRRSRSDESGTSQEVNNQTIGVSHIAKSSMASRWSNPSILSSSDEVDNRQSDTLPQSASQPIRPRNARNNVNVPEQVAMPLVVPSKVPEVVAEQDVPDLVPKEAPVVDSTIRPPKFQWLTNILNSIYNFYVITIKRPWRKVLHFTWNIQNYIIEHMWIFPTLLAVVVLMLLFIYWDNLSANDNRGKYLAFYNIRPVNPDSRIFKDIDAGLTGILEPDILIIN
jgi:hypothetical protein